MMNKTKTTFGLQKSGSFYYVTGNNEEISPLSRILNRVFRGEKNGSRASIDLGCYPDTVKASIYKLRSNGINVINNLDIEL